MGKGDDTRTRILDEAMRQVSVRGIKGVSLGDLAASLDLSKSGVLKHFQSMEALQLALLEAMTERFIAEVWAPAEPFPAGRERLDKLFERELIWSNHDTLPGGCPLTSAATELDDQPGPLRDKLKDNRVRWAKTLKREFRAMHPDADEETLETLVFQFKGIILAYLHSQRLLDDEDAKRQATSAYRMLVGAKG